MAVHVRAFQPSSAAPPLAGVLINVKQKYEKL